MKMLYTLMDAILASPTEPLSAEKRRHQLTRMWDGLRALELDEKPTTDAWRVVSDAVNLMETLVEMKHVEDSQGLLIDAITALAEAGKRHIEGKSLRLSGTGIIAVRGVLEDYTACLDVLPARVVITCHRLTEKRIRAILQGRRRPHDVEIIQA